MNNKTKHIPVLLNEVIELLAPQTGGIYVDATLGGGGHFERMIETAGDNAKTTFIGFDHDKKAIQRVQDQLKLKFGREFTKIRENIYELVTDKDRILLINSNFENISKELDLIGIDKVDGIVADLGTSQDQLEDTERGFSFIESGPLDMRMDNRLGVKASDLLKVLSKQELFKLFNNLADLGQEGRQIVDAIVSTREEKEIETTDDLRKIINRAVPLKSVGSRTEGIGNKRNLEARVFQALRIAVNHELFSLQQFLPQAYETLSSSGKLIIISFHSGEDRIVKHYFKDLINQKKADYLEKLLIPSPSEIRLNTRSSSAKLRAVIKK